MPDPASSVVEQLWLWSEKPRTLREQVQAARSVLNALEDQGTGDFLFDEPTAPGPGWKLDTPLSAFSAWEGSRPVARVIVWTALTAIEKDALAQATQALAPTDWTLVRFDPQTPEQWTMINGHGERTLPWPGPARSGNALLDHGTLADVLRAAHVRPNPRPSRLPSVDAAVAGEHGPQAWVAARLKTVALSEQEMQGWWSLVGALLKNPPPISPAWGPLGWDLSGAPRQASWYRSLGSTSNTLFYAPDVMAALVEPALAGGHRVDVQRLVKICGQVCWHDGSVCYDSWRVEWDAVFARVCEPSEHWRVRGFTLDLTDHFGFDAAVFARLPQAERVGLLEEAVRSWERHGLKLWGSHTVEVHEATQNWPGWPDLLARWHAIDMPERPYCGDEYLDPLHQTHQAYQAAMRAGRLEDRLQEPTRGRGGPRL